MRKITLIALTFISSLAFINYSSDDNKGSSNQDCFDCSKMAGVTVRFCYTEGDTFYTMSAAGQSSKHELDGRTWNEIKPTLKEACDLNK